MLFNLLFQVCELHFLDSDIERETSAYDEKTGKKITVNLSRTRVKRDAVPKLFPGCPTYLSSHKNSREEPESKLLRRENEQLHEAIKESIKSKEEEDSKFRFSTYSEFLNCLNREDISSAWIVVKKDLYTMFLIIDVDGVPNIRCSVKVDNYLNVSAFLGDTEVKTFDDTKFPFMINDMRHLHKILEHLTSVDSDKHLLTKNSIVNIIEKLQLESDENSLFWNFFLEQMKLLNCSPKQRRYSSYTMVFFTLLYSISPHAYNFLRHSGYVTVPHPSTIRNLCAGLQWNPRNEQLDEHFLNYVKQKFQSLEHHERIVSLMLDEIHIKSYFDYKGGNIVGMAHNSKEAATSAHVFMVQSFLSSYKDVAHVLPVKTICAEDLFSVLKKVIIGLEKIGFMVICLVSDNNSINRKALSYFSNPPKLSIVYPHPIDPNRPLFFVIDSVHILKCVRNNWINQKNSEKCMYFPDFDKLYESVSIKCASFNTLKKLHEIEKANIVKYEHKLTFKALEPSNLERQNVKLVLQVFNEYVVNALLLLGQNHDLPCSLETAKYIELIYHWWCIMNVKSPHKGIRLRNSFMQPLTVSSHDENLKFLLKFLDWLDVWKNASCTDGVLTKETHLAITHTTHALTEMAKYCINELKMNYFLCGKVQTDTLEERFGKYRYLAGCQYNVSIRQIFECETKLRLQNSLHLTVHSNTYGKIDVGNFNFEQNWGELKSTSFENSFDISVTGKDIEAEKSLIPILTFLAGYCIHSVHKHLKCSACFDQLSVDKELVCNEDTYKLINGLDRGGLKYPKEEIILVVLFCYIVVKKLLSQEFEEKFLRMPNQRLLVTSIAFNILTDAELFNLYDVCSLGHFSESIVKHILWVASNILLKNYCVKKNDTSVSKVCKKRKLDTLKKPNILSTL
jgi:hypothetical protein